MAILINILLVLNLIIGLLLILVTLMQRPKQEGLGAAFGGGMTENMFGAQTTNVLAKATRWLGGLFLGISLLISSLYARQVNTKSSIQEELLKAPQPTAPAASPEATAAAPEASAPAAEATPAAPAAEATPETAPQTTPEATPAPVIPAPEATATPEAAVEAAPESTVPATPETSPEASEPAP